MSKRRLKILVTPVNRAIYMALVQLIIQSQMGFLLPNSVDNLCRNIHFFDIHCLNLRAGFAQEPYSFISHLNAGSYIYASQLCAKFAQLKDCAIRDITIAHQID